VLWAAGWKPFELTKTHQNFLRLQPGEKATPKGQPMTQAEYKQKLERFETYGYSVSESNLKTLPEDAPEGSKSLAEWLTLEGRRSSLVEWLGQVREDNRIHGSIMHIGAWTGRCAHKSPNTANIASPFHGDAKSPVDVVKKQYDRHLRECWCVPDGSWLVGADADGIQLRVLADYLWRHFDATQYAEAIMEGKKEDNTDIHNVNRAALGVEHATRDDAKTFIYSWLLGAGVAKTASILRITEREATAARDRFERGIEGLYKLKNDLIPYIWEQKFFTGYDGRKVIVPSKHKTLAGILQNGEAVLMKHSLLRWHEKARAEGINFKMVGFIHDEYQVEVIGSEDEAHAMGKLISDTLLETGEELGFKIPTPGTYDIGKNWADTH
jgi:DNA polymerase-1